MAIIESIMNEIMKNEIVAESTVAIDKKSSAMIAYSLMIKKRI